MTGNRAIKVFVLTAAVGLAAVPAWAEGAPSAAPGGSDAQLAESVSDLHAIRMLGLKPDQFREIIQQLDRIESAQRALADKEAAAAAATTAALHRVHGALLAGHTPAQADEDAVNQALDALKPQRAKLETVRQEALTAIRQELTAAQMKKLRDYLGLPASTQLQQGNVLYLNGALPVPGGAIALPLEGAIDGGAPAPLQLDEGKLGERMNNTVILEGVTDAPNAWYAAPAAGPAQPQAQTVIRVLTNGGDALRITRGLPGLTIVDGQQAAVAAAGPAPPPTTPAAPPVPTAAPPATTPGEPAGPANPPAPTPTVEAPEPTPAVAPAVPTPYVETPQSPTPVPTAPLPVGAVPAPQPTLPPAVVPGNTDDQVKLLHQILDRLTEIEDRLKRLEKVRRNNPAAEVQDELDRAAEVQRKALEAEQEAVRARLDAEQQDLAQLQANGAQQEVQTRAIVQWGAPATGAAPAGGVSDEDMIGRVFLQPEVLSSLRALAVQAQ